MKLARLLLLAKCAVPAQLPQTDAELEAWVADVLELGQWPDERTYRIAIAQMILHSRAKSCRAPKLGFANELKRSIANDVAFRSIERLKAEAKAANQQPAPEAADGQDAQGPASQVVS